MKWLPKPMQNDLLDSVGWSEAEATGIGSFPDELLGVANQLGRPVALRSSIGPVQKLVPTENPSFKNSLTSKYKLGEFPLHTDTAHWPIPCRYIVLGCEKEGDSKRYTNLVDFSTLDLSDEERTTLLTEPFKIVNGRRSFYGTVLSEGRRFVRHDPGCMSATSLTGEMALSVFSKHRTAQITRPIEWVSGKIVVIDNWRVMHGRGQLSGQGSERVIWRVLVL
jgi:hypothetical protein